MNHSEPTVFLDTTALIDYIIKADRRNAIRTAAGPQAKWFALHYVKMEIKRGFLQYLVYLHNKLVSCATFAEVQQAIAQLSITPQRHRLSTILETLADFWKTIGQTNIPQARTRQDLDDYVRRSCISYLRILIRRLWSQIDQVIDSIPNPMICYADITGARMKGEYFVNAPSECQGSGVECQIKTFFKNNSASFEAILTRLQTLQNPDEETQKRIRALKEILRLLPFKGRKFSNHQPNVRSCWSSGDAIIAVGAPPGSVVLNNNPQHMNDICNAAGRVSRTYMTTHARLPVPGSG